MRTPNTPRLTKVYETLKQHPGSTIGDLGRLTGLSYNTIQALLPTMDSQGFYLSEDQYGRLYPFNDFVSPCLCEASRALAEDSALVVR
jgi:hypothetical protein